MELVPVLLAVGWAAVTTGLLVALQPWPVAAPPMVPRSRTTTRTGRAARAAAMPASRFTGPARLAVQREAGLLLGPCLAGAAAPCPGLRLAAGAGYSRDRAGWGVAGGAGCAGAGLAAGGPGTAASWPPSSDQPTWACTAGRAYSHVLPSCRPGSLPGVPGAADARRTTRLDTRSRRASSAEVTTSPSGTPGPASAA